MIKFRWLHLTDLHFGQKGQGHLWPNVREAFFNRLGRLHDACGPWDLVLFTGDLVQMGTLPEFRRLDDQVLGPLWQHFSKLGSEPKLLAVPGNHDLEWPNPKTNPRFPKDLVPAARALTRDWKDDEIRKEFWDDHESGYRKVIDLAFANYVEWWRECPLKGDLTIQSGVLPGDFSASWERDSVRLGIVGLNTTFLQLRGGMQPGDLAWDVRQLHAVCDDDPPAWTASHDLCLLLTHQPTEWLDEPSREKEQAEIAPAGRFAVHLCGHQHENETLGSAFRGGPQRWVWQGNSLFGMEQFDTAEQEDRRHGFSIGELAFEDDGAMLRQWPLKALRDQNGWRFVPDDNCVLEEDGGTRPERIESRHRKREAVSKPQPASSPGLEAAPADASYRRMAPPPDRFIPRQELDEIVALLRDTPKAAGHSVAITTALRGAGGFGKTAIAQALAWDERVHRIFPDGVLWTIMGEGLTEGKGLTEDERLEKIRDLLDDWTGKRPDIGTIERAGYRLRTTLEDTRVLVIIDDVWSSKDVEPFRGLGPGTALLITTRKRRTLPTDCKCVDVDAMSLEEAVKLLASDLTIPDIDTWKRLRRLASRLGKWPLLLKLVNRHLRWPVQDHHLPLIKAIRRIENILVRGRIKQLNVRNPTKRDEAVDLTMQVSLRALSKADRKCYKQLAIFPEDLNIPLKILARLWKIADEAGAGDLCVRLADLSLLLNLDLDAGTIRLHDVFRKYLRDNQIKTLHRINRSFIGILYSDARLWANLDPNSLDDAYLWNYLTYHLIEADRTDLLRNILLDFDYLWAKLNATDVNALMTDYSRAMRAPELADDAELQAVQGALGLSLPVLSRDGNQLAGQLLGRLSPQDHPGLQDFLERAQAYSWFRPRVATLTSPGGQALIRTLEGHEDCVRAVTVINAPTADDLPDDWPQQMFVSAADDRTLRVWDAITGETWKTLKGHEGWIRAVASLDGRRIVSASDDGTLRLWDLTSEDGEPEVLEGHNSVNAIAVIDENQIVTASRDGTLRVVNITTGEEVRKLEGHENWVREVAVNGKQLAVSASDDKTLRVWDLGTGETRQILEGHDDGVTAVAWVDERHVVSASSDSTLRLWDVESGGEIRVFEKKHKDAVNSLAVIGNGDSRCVISASSDKTLRKWDLETGKELQKLEGHIGAINAVAEIPGGPSSQCRVVSASSDHTLKVWDVATGVEPHRGHRKAVEGIVALNASEEDGDNKIVSISRDLTLRVWDVAKGLQERSKDEKVWANAVTMIDEQWAVLGRPDGGLRALNLENGKSLQFKGHELAVNTVARIDKRRLVSGSSDHTLWIWSVDTKRKELALKKEQILKGHTSGVLAVAVIDAEDMEPCHIVSASDDDTLRVWNLETGESQTLEGHKSWINAVAVIDKDRIVSASADGTLRVWNLKTGKEIGLLKDCYSKSWVNAVAVIDEHRVVSASADHALRLWDIETGKMEDIFELEDAVQSVFFEFGVLVAGDQSGKLHVFDLAERVEDADKMDRGELTIRSDKPHNFKPQSSELFEELGVKERDWERHLGVTFSESVLDDIGRTDQKGEPPTPEKMDLLGRLFTSLCKANRRNEAGLLFAEHLWGPLFYIYDEREYMLDLLKNSLGIPEPTASLRKMGIGEVFALNQLANVLRMSGLASDAAEIHRKIIDHDKELIRKNDTAKPKAFWQNVLAVRQELLGLDQVNSGQYSEAISNLRKSHDLSFGLEPKGYGNANRATCLRDLGRLSIRTGEYAEALRYLREAGTLARGGEARKYLAAILRLQCRAWLGLERPGEALTRGDAAVDSDRVRKKSHVQVDVLLARADARRMNGDLKGAIDDVRQVLGRERIDFRNKASAEIGLARLYLEDECTEKALEAAERALSDARQGGYAELEKGARLILDQLRP